LGQAFYDAVEPSGPYSGAKPFSISSPLGSLTMHPLSGRANQTRESQKNSQFFSRYLTYRFSEELFFWRVFSFIVVVG